MGGYGSGRWYSWGGKTTTESQHRIDIRWLKKQGFLRPGTAGVLSWSKGDEQTGSIGYRMEAKRMILNFRHRPNGGEWEPVEQSISFDRTPCNYGGTRTWFLCSRCWKRVAVLYGAGRYFLCRHCYDLVYASQQEGRLDRLMRKIAKIRERLGASESPSMPILYKPKNMHYKTFQRMKREADDADRLYWTIVNRIVGIEQTRENNSLGRR
jgi:hypothetical protein